MIFFFPSRVDVDSALLCGPGDFSGISWAFSEEEFLDNLPTSKAGFGHLDATWKRKLGRVLLTWASVHDQIK
jgi:hypothetical protein